MAHFQRPATGHLSEENYHAMNRILRTFAVIATAAAAALSAPAIASAAPAPSVSAGLVNATYVAIQPCRIVDTRLIGGNIGNSATRSFTVSGTTGFDSQGGKSGGCGIPANATGIAADLTAIQPKAAGFLRAYPRGTAETTATVLNYAPFAVIHGNTENAAILSVASTGITVKNFQGPTGLVIDVTGYFAPQLVLSVDASGSLLNGGGGTSGITNPAAGQYLITTDADITNCVPSVSLLNNSTGALLPLTIQANVLDAHTVGVDVGLLDLLGLGINVGGTNAPFALNITC